MSTPMYCVNHPNVETYLRCNKCGQPVCSKCIVQTPVGYRCKRCINVQQRVFYADFRTTDYVIAGAVALPLSLGAGWLIPMLGGLYAFVLGPLAGGVIAELARRATRRRRGQYTWLVVCGCIVVGVLPRLVQSLLSLLLLPTSLMDPGGASYVFGGLMGLVWSVGYLATAVGAAYLLLRPGRRV